ncbi:MAG: hypothetical protein AB7E79_01345 [Rhodospirillaceae bacterium]
MSENRIFVMDPEVLATCGIALADGETAREIAKTLPAALEAASMPIDEPAPSAPSTGTK